MPTNDHELTLELLKEAVLASSEGITITDMTREDQPLVFVNRAFETMTGYSGLDVLGKNCRFLQGQDTDKAAVVEISQAIAKGAKCEVTLRNYRKTGELFWNRLNLSPVTNSSGQVTHYVGIQRDVSREILVSDNLKRLNKLYVRINQNLAEESETDLLTGMHNRRHLETAFKPLFANAQREHWTLNAYLIDIDNFKTINDQHGHPFGDLCLQYVAGCIGEMFARDGDICVRLGGDEFLVVTINHGEFEPHQRATELKRRISSKNIQVDNNDIKIGVSVGAIAVQPGPGDSIDSVIHNVDIAMYQDKANKI